MLEDLCMESVQDDSVMPCLEAYLDCVFKKAQDPPKNKSKARVHAFLASRKKSDLRLGEAALNSEWKWPLDHPAFDELKNFFRKLAEPFPG